MANERESRELDASYKPFPTFQQWLEQVSFETYRWDRDVAAIKVAKENSSTLVSQALNVAKRAAAFDTGAIEGLYDTDRGFTYTVAFETTAWEVSLNQKGEKIRSLFEAQLSAYDYVLDLATNAEQFSEASIRHLHEIVCAAQDTYRVMTAIGPQEQPLPKGQYKSLPNHVRTREGAYHSYAPVDVTPDEMNRLMTEVRSDLFFAAHPVVQASYIHYCFVVIHPFADGNGRVARALASIFTYRAASSPIVILSEQKVAYLDALVKADEGDFQPFVDFMLFRTLDTFQLVTESMKTAAVSDVAGSIAKVARLYRTQGGFSHEQVDEFGAKLIQLFKSEASIESGKISENNISGQISDQPGHGADLKAFPRHRLRLGGPGLMSVRVAMNTAPPISAQVVNNYYVLVPKDARGQDDVLIVRKQNSSLEVVLQARIDELNPVVSGALLLRLRIVMERIVAEMYPLLAKAASDAFSKSTLQ